MVRHPSSDKRGGGRNNRFSWPTALAFWIGVSVIGWLLIGSLFLGFRIDDPAHMAGDNDKPVDIAPASGPEDTPAQ